MTAGPSNISKDGDAVMQNTENFIYNTTMSVQQNQNSHHQWRSRELPNYQPADSLNMLNIHSYLVNNAPKTRKPRTCVTCRDAGKDGTTCPRKDRKDRCITKISRGVIFYFIYFFISN
jgi:hypothetical protein